MRPADTISLSEAAQYIGRRRKVTVRVAEGLLHAALRLNQLAAWGDFYNTDIQGVQRVPASTWDDLTTKQFHSYTLGCNIPKHPLATAAGIYKGHFQAVLIGVDNINQWLDKIPHEPAQASFDDIKSWLINSARENGRQILSRDESWERCQRHFGSRKAAYCVHQDAFKEVCRDAVAHGLTPPQRGRKTIRKKTIKRPN